MPVDQSDKSGVVPGPDKNAPVPPIPEDHRPQTPEFLNKLIEERNELQAEQSKLWSERYGIQPSMSRETKPSFQQVIEYERRDQELDQKINAITTEINGLRWLIARQTPATQNSS